MLSGRSLVQEGNSCIKPSVWGGSGAKCGGGRRLVSWGRSLWGDMVGVSAGGRWLISGFCSLSVGESIRPYA